MFQDVVNCIGGIQVLFPLLEQVNKIPVPKDILSPDVPVIENLNKPLEQDEWVILPSSSYAGKFFFPIGWIDCCFTAHSTVF